MSTPQFEGQTPRVSALEWVKGWLEYLGCARDAAPSGSTIDSPVFRAIWWSMLFLAAWAFSGQSSKFIYIDF